MHLQPREELVGVLVLVHVDGLAVVVLERLPEAAGVEAGGAAQSQVCEDDLAASGAVWSGQAGASVSRVNQGPERAEYQSVQDTNGGAVLHPIWFVQPGQSTPFPRQ